MRRLLILAEMKQNIFNTVHNEMIVPVSKAKMTCAYTQSESFLLVQMRTVDKICMGKITFSKINDHFNNFNNFVVFQTCCISNMLRFNKNWANNSL